jgi:hypothetical protein
MSDTITYDPFDNRRTAADTSVKILALLEEGLFLNRNQIQNSNILVSELQKARLQKHLEYMKSNKLLEHWDDLSDDEQKIYKKSNPTFDSKAGKHIYRITQIGREKFQKVRDDCLDDPVIQRILRARVEEPNN